MVALLQAAARPDYPAEIVLVLSNRADAAGLERAAAMGIATAVVESRGRRRDEFEAAMSAVLAEHRIGRTKWAPSAVMCGSKRARTAARVAAFSR